MNSFTDLQQAESSGNEFRQFIFELVSALSGEKDCARRLNSLLDAALDYYGADRAYVIEGDTELVTAVNTHERCAPGVEYQQDTLKDMPVEAYMRWLDIFQHSKEVVIEDMETLREPCPGEYKYFADSDVRSLIVVPFSKRINHGFVGVDNPRKHRDDSMTLHIVSYAVALELNEIKLIKENTALMDVSKYPESIVHIHLLGDLRIAARGGTIQQNPFSVQGHALFAIMLLNPEKQFSMDELYDIISPAKESYNPSVVVANAIYKVRNCLDIIGLRELILTDHGRYYLNPKYQIETDVDRFRQFATAMKDAEDESEKLSLGEEALSLYVNPLPPAICNDIRLVLEQSELECTFLDVTKECASIYMNRQDYGKALQIISNAMRNNPLETELMLYRIRLMKKSGSSGLKSYIHKIKSYLDESELKELQAILEDKE